MKFMMLLKADKNTEAGVLPSAKDLEVMGKYNQQLIDAGVLDGAGLQPSSKGARVTFPVQRGLCGASGPSLTRHDLSEEAIRLGRLLVELLPEPEVIGLLALMLLHESRRAARTSPTGEVILLEDQDRSAWNRDHIAEGVALVQRALRPALSERRRVEGTRRAGPYTLQAAIAAVHAEAIRASETDWAQIVGLYDALLRIDPSPVVELNRAVAIAMRDGAEAGLRLIDAILERGDLADYRPAHAARAELNRRLGRTEQARASYEWALKLTQQEPERRFLERRLAELK